MISCKLKDICKLVKGKQIDTSLLAENMPFKYINGGVKESGYYEEYNTNENTIIISEGGASCGYVNYITEKFWLGCHCYKLIDVSVDSKYLFYALKANQQRIMELRTGAAMPNIKKTILNELPIKISMDETEQKQIVEKLDYIEHLLEIQNTILLFLDELTKSRFIEMFGNPSVNDKEWDMVSLSECIDSVDSGKSFVCHANARVDDSPALLKLSAASYGTFRPEENKKLIDDSKFIKKAEVKAGDLLFTRKNTPELVGMCTYVYETPKNLMLPDLIFRLNTNKRCNKQFLWKLINLDSFRKNVRSLATGAAASMSNISQERLLGLKIILPPIGLQNQFASFVEQIDKSKLVIKKTIAELEELKSSLMQKYFFD